MIERVLLDYLNENLSVSAFLEKSGDMPNEYVLFEKVSSNKRNHIPSSTFAFQSYGKSMYEVAVLNEELKETVENMIILNEISGIRLNSDYNFTDTETKEYRYQAVFDINHY